MGLGVRRGGVLVTARSVCSAAHAYRRKEEARGVSSQSQNAGSLVESFVPLAVMLTYSEDTENFSAMFRSWWTLVKSVLGLEDEAARVHTVLSDGSAAISAAWENVFGQLITRTTCWPHLSREVQARSKCGGDVQRQNSIMVSTCSLTR